MASATELAIKALVAALNAKSDADTTVLPAPRRNESVANRFAQLTGNSGGYLNVLDGSGGPEGPDGSNGEYLGADALEDAGRDAYELVQHCEIEWLVDEADGDTRETAFDNGLVGINDAIRADRTLGGAVSTCFIEKIERSNLLTDGLSTVKACIITVALNFTSPHPF